MGISATMRCAAVEDTEIEKLVRRQEEIGLAAVTDGEVRRAFWHFDFFEGLDGVEGRWHDDAAIRFHAATSRPRGMHVTGPIGFPRTHPMLEAFPLPEEHDGAGGEDDPALAQHALLSRREKACSRTAPIGTWPGIFATWAKPMPTRSMRSPRPAAAISSSTM